MFIELTCMSNPDILLFLQANPRFLGKETRKSNPTHNLYRGKTTNKSNHGEENSIDKENIQTLWNLKKVLEDGKTS